MYEYIGMNESAGVEMEGIQKARLPPAEYLFTLAFICSFAVFVLRATQTTIVLWWDGVLIVI